MRYIFLKFPYQETWQRFLEILPIFWQSQTIPYLISSHVMSATLKFKYSMIVYTSYYFCYMAFDSLSEILTKHLELHLTGESYALSKGILLVSPDMNHTVE